jgi:arsenite-transporting ATPase
MPSTLEWYIKKIFKLERNLMRIARPVAKRLTDVPMPEESYFGSIQDLFLKLEGVDEVLLNNKITSVRMVTNAERMVVRETQRAYMYFCLYGLVVDSIIVNRLFPRNLQDEYFADWISSQDQSLKDIRDIFDPIPILPVNILKDEVSGYEKLSEMGSLIYRDADPSELMHEGGVYEVVHRENHYELKIKLPFITKDYVDLFKDNGDLVVRIGSFKRHVLLPRALAALKPEKASLDNNMLSIRFMET